MPQKQLDQQNLNQSQVNQGPQPSNPSPSGQEAPIPPWKGNCQFQKRPAVAAQSSKFGIVRDPWGVSGPLKNTSQIRNCPYTPAPISQVRSISRGHIPSQITQEGVKEQGLLPSTPEIKNQSIPNILNSFTESQSLTSKHRFDLSFLGLGLSSEAGEVAGEIKKLIRDDNGTLSNDRRDRIISEIGDVLWYSQGILAEVDSSLGEALEINIKRTQVRKNMQNSGISSSIGQRQSSNAKREL